MPSVEVLRKRLGLSARQLAAASGVAPSTITRIEAGTLRSTQDVLERIYDALGYEFTSRRRVKPEATLGARLLTEPERTLPPSDAAIQWIMQWTAAKLEPRELLSIAGRTSRLQDRQG